LPLIKQRLVGRQQGGHLFENDTGKSKRVFGHHVAAANSFKLPKGLPVLRHGLSDVIRRQQRRNFLFQIIST
jgi:hypothetical protein